MDSSTSMWFILTLKAKYIAMEMTVRILTNVRNLSIFHQRRLETETYEDISLGKTVGFLKGLLIRLIYRNPPFHSLCFLDKSPEMTFPWDTMIPGLKLIFEVLRLMFRHYQCLEYEMMCCLYLVNFL